MRKRKRKRKIGNSLRRWGALFALLCLLAPVVAAERKPVTYAVVAGTVFREPGFALPGAEVTLDPGKAPLPKGVKVKRMRTLTDSRGEFLFRVPAAAVRYTVSVKAVGFGSGTKQVEIHGEERADAFFQLKPEPAKP